MGIKQLTNRQMRTIEFRGLRVDGKGWAYGDLLQPHQGNSSTFIAYYNGHITEVNPSTVGQFTGLYDRNGVKVFEGDTVVTDCVLVFGEPVDGFAGVVKYLECCFYIDSGTDALKVWSDAYQVEVTGNIHEPATFRE